MIVVSVGTNQATFDRLLEWVAELRLDEDIVVQHGPSGVRPAGARCVESMRFDELVALVARESCLRDTRRRRLDHDVARSRAAADRRTPVETIRRGSRRSPGRVGPAAPRRGPCHARLRRTRVGRCARRREARDSIGVSGPPRFSTMWRDLRALRAYLSGNRPHSLLPDESGYPGVYASSPHDDAERPEVTPCANSYRRNRRPSGVSPSPSSTRSRRRQNRPR